MTHRVKDGEECINCGACEPTCPNDAISEKQGEDVRWIDPEKCNDCAACIDSCPTYAITAF